MSRKAIPRSLPPLPKVFSGFAGFSESNNKQRLLLDELRKAARRLRKPKSQPFYSMRDIAAFFKTPLRTVAIAYETLESEGLFNRVRSSQTQLIGSTDSTQHVVRGVVGIPIWLLSIVISPYTRVLHVGLEERLRKKGFVADMIFFRTGEDCEPDFADRLLRHNLNTLIWHTPHPLSSQVLLAVRDHGVRCITMQPVETQGSSIIKPNYLMNWDPAYQALAQSWQRSGIRRVFIPRPLYLPSQRALKNFLTLLEECGMEVQQTDGTAASLLEKVRNQKSSAVAFIDQQGADSMCNKDPGIIEQILKISRVAFCRGPPDPASLLRGPSRRGGHHRFLPPRNRRPHRRRPLRPLRSSEPRPSHLQRRLPPPASLKQHQGLALSNGLNTNEPTRRMVNFETRNFSFLRPGFKIMGALHHSRIPPMKLFFIFSLCSLALCLSPVRADDQAKASQPVTTPASEGIKLEGSFSLPKKTYFLGEPMETNFTVVNKGQAAVCFRTGGDYRNSGRHDRYSIKAVDEHGQAVPDPARPSGMGGGVGSSATVNPGDSYTENVLVNLWCAFSKPGKYTITCKRTLHAIRADQRGDDFYSKPENSFPAFPIETTLQVTIEDNPQEQAAYIDGLASTLSDKDEFTDQAGIQLKSLAQAQIPAAFPAITTGLDGQPRIQLMAVEWLSCYGPAKASPVLLDHIPRLAPLARESALRILSDWNTPGVEPLIAAALGDPDHELRANIVLLCSEKWYSSCIPILLTMGNDPDSLVRRYLGAALGASGDKAAIPVLIKLLHDSDPDPFIKIWAAEGLGKFKRMDGVPVMIALLRNPKDKDDQENIMATIEELTGKKFDGNRNACLQWWDKTGRSTYNKPN